MSRPPHHVYVYFPWIVDRTFLWVILIQAVLFLLGCLAALGYLLFAVIERNVCP